MKTYLLSIYQPDGDELPPPEFLAKVMSDIDIAQRNIVQEGHFSSRVPDRRVDYRVSFAPAMFGQKLVVRILDTANTPYHVWDLQLPDWMYETITAAMKPLTT